MRPGRRVRFVLTLAAGSVLSTALLGVPLVAGASPSQRSPDSFLVGVVSLSKSSAWASGAAADSRYVYHGFVQHWDGQRWTTVYVDQTPGRATGEFSAISADSDSDVWAVGTLDSGLGARPLVAHFDGEAWTPVGTTGLHLGWDNQLSAVTALSPEDVWMVGLSYRRHSHISVPLILHWDGSRLSQFTVPSFPKAQAWLNDIDAFGANDIWAVGAASRNINHSRTYVLHWNGVSWSRVSAPRPQGYSELFGVAVSTRSDAWAIGRGGTDTLLEHYDGHGWALRRLRVPNGFLQGTDARTRQDAWIVGWAGDALVTLHWDGVSWHAIGAPSRGDFSSFYAVSDAGPGATWAVGGHSRGGSDDQAPLRELWTGRRWVLH